MPYRNKRQRRNARIRLALWLAVAGDFLAVPVSYWTLHQPVLAMANCVLLYVGCIGLTLTTPKE